MATALTGLGIGLSGLNKDYSQVELANRRQAALEKKAQQQAKDKDYEEITKDIAVKPGEYLPFREKEVKRMTAEYIANAQNANGYGQRQQLKSDYLTNLAKLKNEKLEADKRRDLIYRGNEASRDDINLLYNSPTQEDVQKGATRGGIVFNEADGTFSVNSYPRMDLTQRFAALASKVKNELTQETIMVAGKPQTIFRQPRDVFRKQLEIDFDSDNFVRENAYDAYGKMLEQQGFTGEALKAELKKAYVNNGLNFLSGETTKGAGGGININNNLGLGDGQNRPAMQAVDLSEILMVRQNPFTGETEQGVFNLSNSRSLGDATATIPKGVGAYYADTGEAVSDADLEKAVFNEMGNGLVFATDVTVKTPKGPVTYKKGTPILQGFETLALQNDWAKPAMLVSLSSNGRNILTDAARYMQTKAISASKDDAPVIEQNLLAMKNDFEEFKKETERRIKAVKEAKQKRVGGQATTAPKPNQGGSRTPVQAAPKTNKKFINAPSGGFN